MGSDLYVIDRASLPSGFSWNDVVSALKDGHRRPRARITDQFLTSGDRTCMNRAAWIEGLGVGVKTFTVFPENAQNGRATVQGAMLIFDDTTGSPLALIDSDLVTYWKTAADSVYGASLLARPDSRTLVIVGTGVVAESLIDAYSAMFPELERIIVWGRNPAKSAALAARHQINGCVVEAATELAVAAGQADIVSCATLSKSPVLFGRWLRPGTHVDLIGAFRAFMREADDDLLQRSRLFVDSFDTTLDHIGELLIPLREGVIERRDILGDLYDLEAGNVSRTNGDEITVFKNGGGAHLDLMTARTLLAHAFSGGDQMNDRAMGDCEYHSISRMTALLRR